MKVITLGNIDAFIVKPTKDSGLINEILIDGICSENANHMRVRLLNDEAIKLKDQLNELLDGAQPVEKETENPDIEVNGYASLNKDGNYVSIEMVDRNIKIHNTIFNDMATKFFEKNISIQGNVSVKTDNRFVTIISGDGKVKIDRKVFDLIVSDYNEE